MRGLQLASLVALGVALAACGGGGGGGGSEVVSTPPVTPQPVASPKVISDVTSTSAIVYAGSGIGETPGVLPSIDIKYDPLTKVYEVKGSAGTFSQLVDHPEYVDDAIMRTADKSIFVNELDLAQTFTASALVSWVEVYNARFGYTALGTATPTSEIPLTGSATYSGEMRGYSNELVDGGPWGYGDVNREISGDISLAFNFTAGTLSGSALFSVSPTPIAFTNTIYSTGSQTFSGMFDTATSGTNSFSGQFTGTGAKELIGSFALPYVSLLDDKTYQARGAFVAKK